MIDYEAFNTAMGLVFTWQTMAWMLVGIAVGVGVGAMPGLQSSTAVALMLPLTFNMPLASALGLLIGLYKGTIYGGSISAISFATPGTPEAAATVADGYKLMQQGKGKKALHMALYASVTADFLSDLITILMAPMLAMVALTFGPAERMWVLVLAITLVGGLSGRHLAKGMFSAALGLYVGTMGSDPIGLVPRNTFGLWWLRDGVPLPPLVIGIFAMSLVFHELLKPEVLNSVKSRVAGVGAILLSKSEGLTLREYLQCWKEMAIGLGVGTFVGVLPGLGATVGAFLSYAVARQASPDKPFGEGALEGVAAAEAGNNATVGPTLVPLLAFGIPGSATTALIGGALIMQGATPSPRMFDLFPHVIYALFMILLIGNLVNLFVGRLFAGIYAKIGEIPRPYLVPLIGAMAVLGTYAYQTNPYHIYIMLACGLLGFLFRLLDIPAAPFVITFMVAPLAEANLRKAFLIGGGNWIETLFNSPLSTALCIVCIVSIYAAARLRINDRVKETAIKATRNV
ncbi:MAG TPA: hypothetical protein ENJ99_07330 [Rhizobiales bacterium]|nr:hypothetical protein [Hyphomicrobiales bacterium]